MIFGERLKHLREGRYSQEDLAEKLNVHNNTISKWENGSQVPRAKNVAELARVLGTTSAYLMGDTDKIEAAPQYELPMQEGAGQPLNMNNMLYFKSGTFELAVPDNEKNSKLFQYVVNRILDSGVSQPKGDIDASMNILDGGHSNNYHGNVVTAKA